MDSFVDFEALLSLHPPEPTTTALDASSDESVLKEFEHSSYGSGSGYFCTIV